jgi:GT2 family glycosyltransferase
MKYAAFIITYKRPDILRCTIDILLQQTLRPEKILIVDNDQEKSAMFILENYSSDVVSYYPVGYNSGPAGGAYNGLKYLFEQGWDWVLWVDDDDPPSANNQIENILAIVDGYKRKETIGMIGASGVLYNYNFCTINRIADENLKGILEVDMIAGNQLPLVHRRVFEAGILPDPNLFFGFEDLEYGLKLKRKGFSLLVSGEEMYRLRLHFNRLGGRIKKVNGKSINSLWREYYSIRTIAFILRNNQSYIIAIFYAIRILFKAVISFYNGWNYGIVSIKLLFKGFMDGYRRRMGLTVHPQSKYNS